MVAAQTVGAALVIVAIGLLLVMVTFAVAEQAGLVLSVTVQTKTVGTPAVKPVATAVVGVLFTTVTPGSEEDHVPDVPAGGVLATKFTVPLQTVPFAVTVLAVTLVVVTGTVTICVQVPLVTLNVSPVVVPEGKPLTTGLITVLLENITPTGPVHKIVVPPTCVVLFKCMVVPQLVA